jgi:predicted transcriptional regulator
LPVINKSKRMVGMISLGDISQFAPNDLLTGWVKSVAAHH